MGTPCTHTHNEQAASPQMESQAPIAHGDDGGTHRRPLWAGPQEWSFTPDRPSPAHNLAACRLLWSVAGEGGLGTLTQGFRGDPDETPAGVSAGSTGPALWRSPGEGRWTGLRVAVLPALCPRPLEQRTPPLRCEAHLCGHGDSASLQPCRGSRPRSRLQPLVYSRRQRTTRPI